MTHPHFEYYAHRILTHFGWEHQKMKMVEEMAELATEFARSQDGRSTLDKQREELADVIILAEQMRFSLGPDEVDAKVEEKIGRTLSRYGIE